MENRRFAPHDDLRDADRKLDGTFVDVTVGAEQLTSYKYQVLGTGQVRP